MSDKTDLTISMISDVVCPWCYLGLRRLDAACAQLPEITVALSFRPFLLDPTVPADGRPYREALADKFGDMAQVDAAFQRLTALGREAGIAFDFDAIARQVNSLDAHRLIRWASEAEVERAAVDALFKRHFCDGADISNIGVLADVAEEIGMDGEEVSDWLTTDVDVDAIGRQIADVQRMGVTGVPCFLIEDKYAVMGAQDVATLAGALRDIAEEKRFGRKQ